MSDFNGLSSKRPDTQTQSNGLKPNKVINVPQEYRRTTRIRERERLAHTLKVETGCEVVPHWDEGRIIRFEIFGTGAGADRVIAEINQWILHAKTKSSETTAWAKTRAFDYNKWYYEQVREMEDDRKKVFKQPIPEEWNVPFKDLRDHDPSVIPKDVFGLKLEMLDPLRTEHEVWINPLMNPLWQIEIQGFEMDQVDAAEDHYRSMIQKIKTKTFGASSPLHIILDENEGIEVLLGKAEPWWPNQASKIVPRLLPSPMMNELGEFRTDGLHFTQLSVVQHAVQQALEAIRYEKGSYDFCVRFGCLALSSQHMPDTEIGRTYPKDRFLNDINGRVNCETKNWLTHNDAGGKLLARLVAAEHLFEPTKAAGFFGYTPSSLKETRPMFRGTWVFRDPNALRLPEQQAQARHSGRPSGRAPQNTEAPKKVPSPSLVIVQIDWTDDEDGLYEKMEPRFYLLKSGETSPKENMDLKLLELGEGKGWQFSLESMVHLSKKMVSPALIGFAQRVKMKPGYQIQSDEIFAQWTNNTNIVSGRLDKIYAFGLRKTCYRIQVVQMWYPQQKHPCWGLNVRHSEWATHLAELERLPIGLGAEWRDCVTTFLPDDGVTSDDPLGKPESLGLSNMRLSGNIEAPPRDGIRLLITKLMEISEIVNNTGGIPIRSS